MKLLEERRHAVERVIRDRFAGKVQRVEMESSVCESGEEILLIRVHFASDTTAGDFSGKFFGLTGRVKTAMGEELEGVFPVIRPMEARA
jgi:hypothetical protein